MRVGWESTRLSLGVLLNPLTRDPITLPQPYSLPWVCE